MNLLITQALGPHVPTSMEFLDKVPCPICRSLATIPGKECCSCGEVFLKPHPPAVIDVSPEVLASMEARL